MPDRYAYCCGRVCGLASLDEAIELERARQGQNNVEEEYHGQVPTSSGTRRAALETSRRRTQSQRQSSEPQSTNRQYQPQPPTEIPGSVRAMLNQLRYPAGMSTLAVQQESTMPVPPEIHRAWVDGGVYLTFSRNPPLPPPPYTEISAETPAEAMSPTRSVSDVSYSSHRSAVSSTHCHLETGPYAGPDERTPQMPQIPAPVRRRR